MRKLHVFLFGAFILIGVGLFLFHRMAVDIFGVSYDPNNSDDLQKLMVIADTSRPFRSALERFKQDHGSYPARAGDLFPSYLQSTNGPNDYSDWAGWHYEPESTNSYQLFFHPAWDDGFWLERSNGVDHWTYSTSVANTDLTQKFSGE
jgi:hypothetical protein